MTPAPAPRWRQVFDAAERAVAPRAETFVRTPTFAIGTALLRRAQTVVSESARGLSARAWHLVNLPAGSDVSRLRAQIGALDREVRRLSLQLEAQRRRPTASIPEKPDADGPQPADGPRPRPARRRTQRPEGT